MYDDPDVLQARIDEYFDKGVNKRTIQVGTGKEARFIEVPIPTISGLALYLGFCDRHSFYAYEKHEGFSHTIKTARARIEQSYEESLRLGGNPAGAIFALKNFGWSDRLEITGAGGGPIKQEQSVKFDWSKVPDDELEGIVNTAEKFLSTL